MSNLVPPHGSKKLKTLALHGSERKSELKKAESLPRLMCSSREFGDVVMLGIGGFTPLDGFMNRADWQSVCDNMTMKNGLFWPIPITLSTNDKTIKEDQEVAIVYEKTNEIIATMVITEKYTIDKSMNVTQFIKQPIWNILGLFWLCLKGNITLLDQLKFFLMVGSLLNMVIST